MELQPYCSRIPDLPFVWLARTLLVGGLWLTILSGAACGEPHPTHPADPDATTVDPFPEPPAFARAGPPGVRLPVFEPRTLLREAGPPETVAWTFATEGFAGPFELVVVNGDARGGDRATSGRILLDGKQVVGPADFKRKGSRIERRVKPFAVAGLAASLEGRPGSRVEVRVVGLWTFPPPRVRVESGGRVTATVVGGASARLETRGANGSVYRLDVPPTALPPGERVTLSLTPIGEAHPLVPPLSSAGGVRLEPHGLRFEDHVELHVDPGPSSPVAPVVLRYSGDGSASHFLPTSPAEGPDGGLTLSLLGFSDIILADGEVSECVAATNPATQREAFQTAVSCARRALALRQVVDPGATLTPEERALVEAILREWFDTFVLPLIHAARDGAELHDAATEFHAWRGNVQLVGFESELADRTRTGGDALVLRMSGFVEELNQRCLAATEPCDQYARFGDAVKLVEDFQRLGDVYSLDVALPGVHELCDGLQARLVDQVVVTPVATTLQVGGIGTLEVHLLHGTASAESAPWGWTVEPEGVVEVTAGPDRTLSLTGVAPGTAEVTVTAGCGKSATVTVIVSAEIDLTGIWTFDITEGPTQCPIEAERYTADVTVQQDGDMVRFGPLIGWFDGEGLRVSGSYAQEDGLTSEILEASVEADGNRMSGASQWTWRHDTQPLACTGSRTFTGVRNSGPTPPG